jgi:hypothetical protein
MRPIVEKRAAAVRWLQYHGALFGSRKAQEVQSAQVMLMPGLVGLAVLDSFAGSCPLITRDVEYHSPEIEYLRHDSNGLVLPRDDSATGYGSSVADLLEDTARLKRFVDGCATAAKSYSVKDMASRFAGGICAALSSPRRAHVQR